MRRQWPVADRKRFALRLHRCIERRFKEAGVQHTNSAYVWFTRQLEAGTATRESTVRGWLPPRKRLESYVRDGSGVRPRDWAALKTPDLTTLCDVADTLDVSMDYLRGKRVPMRTSEREPIGELAGALREFVLVQASRLPGWTDADLKAADQGLPEGADLLRLSAHVLIAELTDAVAQSRASRLADLIRSHEATERMRNQASSLIAKVMLERTSPKDLAQIQQLAARPSLPGKRRRLLDPRRPSEKG
jgi:hypothetical protein